MQEVRVGSQVLQHNLVKRRYYLRSECGLLFERNRALRCFVNVFWLAAVILALIFEFSFVIIVSHGHLKNYSQLVIEDWQQLTVKLVSEPFCIGFTSDRIVEVRLNIGDFDSLAAELFDESLVCRRPFIEGAANLRVFVRILLLHPRVYSRNELLDVEPMAANDGDSLCVVVTLLS